MRFLADFELILSPSDYGCLPELLFVVRAGQARSQPLALCFAFGKASARANYFIKIILFL